MYSLPVEFSAGVPVLFDEIPYSHLVVSGHYSQAPHVVRHARTQPLPRHVEVCRAHAKTATCVPTAVPRSLSDVRLSHLLALSLSALLLLEGSPRRLSDLAERRECGRGPHIASYPFIYRKADLSGFDSYCLLGPFRRVIFSKTLGPVVSP